jgi:hypothetical protein
MDYGGIQVFSLILVLAASDEDVNFVDIHFDRFYFSIASVSVEAHK